MDETRLLRTITVDIFHPEPGTEGNPFHAFLTFHIFRALFASAPGTHLSEISLHY
jgi:hypothetical protein